MPPRAHTVTQDTRPCPRTHTHRTPSAQRGHSPLYTPRSMQQRWRQRGGAALGGAARCDGVTYDAKPPPPLLPPPPPPLYCHCRPWRCPRRRPLPRTPRPTPPPLLFSSGALERQRKRRALQLPARHRSAAGPHCSSPATARRGGRSSEQQLRRRDADRGQCCVGGQWEPLGLGQRRGALSGRAPSARTRGHAREQRGAHLQLREGGRE